MEWSWTSTEWCKFSLGCTNMIKAESGKRFSRLFQPKNQTLNKQYDIEYYTFPPQLPLLELLSSTTCQNSYRRRDLCLPAFVGNSVQYMEIFWKLQVHEMWRTVCHFYVSTTSFFNPFLALWYWNSVNLFSVFDFSSSIAVTLQQFSHNLNHLKVISLMENTTSWFPSESSDGYHITSHINTSGLSAKGEH